MEPQEFRQREREITGRVLDRVASDSEFKQQLLDDPETALTAAGFATEIRELELASVGAPGDDTEGYHYTSSGHRRCTWWSMHYSCYIPDDYTHNPPSAWLGVKG